MTQPRVVMSFDEATALIASGRTLMVAADETLLRALPRGNWVGGTIPYFIGQEGGETTRDKLYVSEVLPRGAAHRIVRYNVDTLPQVCVDGPEHGYTLIILPGFSAAHVAYAKDAPDYEDMFIKPIVGWVSGFHLDDFGSASAKVVDGSTGTFSDADAVVMHVNLPPSLHAQIQILNIFEPGNGDVIEFPQGGFNVSRCAVNGRAQSFVDYVTAHKIDTRLPLMADYSGAYVNVCLKSVNADSDTVDFYGPIFEGVSYRFARPVTDYVDQFGALMPTLAAEEIGFSCNCVLNYLYLELEGKRTGQMTGPATFGEIAYQLVNQTMVYMTISAP